MIWIDLKKNYWIKKMWIKEKTTIELTHMWRINMHTFMMYTHDNLDSLHTFIYKYICKQ